MKAIITRNRVKEIKKEFDRDCYDHIGELVCAVENYMNMNEDWRDLIRYGIGMMLDQFGKDIGPDHIRNTPERVVTMFTQCLGGPSLDDARKVLKIGFKHQKISEMIHTTGIQFTSWCAHHIVPILGVAHFAYIPRETIVGLSKVVRLVEMVAMRPQVQEVLTDQIVDIFCEEVKPLGAGLVIDAQHMCMIARGVKKSGTWTRTTKLAGGFFDQIVREEFLRTVPSIPITVSIK